MSAFFLRLSRYTPLLLSSLLLSPWAQADDRNYRIEWEAMATAYSPAQPIHEFINDWRGSL